MALALLALGEAAPGAFPVHVRLEAHGASALVNVDGQAHQVASALGGGWTGLQLEQPGPVEREYQIDGSDTTSTNDRDALFITGLLGTPLYRFDAFLRNEGSYSRWEALSVVDLGSGLAWIPGAGPLPTDFRVDVDLRRPEAAARLWLVGANSGEREGLELDRDTRNARWLIQRGTGEQALPRWFFPEQPMPVVAELLWLLGRSAAAAYALVCVGLLGSGGVRLLRGRRHKSPGATPSFAAREGGKGRSESWSAGRVPLQTWVVLGLVAVLLAGWFAAAAYVTVAAYHQLPHILDAVSYTFQAGLFASGQLSLPLPPDTGAFLGPFEVVWQGRIFSQYPPGAPALYALGLLLHVEWLVGPIACAALIACTAWAAHKLYGAPTGLTVLALGFISPFILFQAGSFLSHPIAGGLLAGALAAFVAGEQKQNRLGWYALTGALLGAAFVTREVAGVLFALPLGTRLIAQRRTTALTYVVAFGLPFLLAYLVYNVRQTGSPLLLPRTLFDAADHFGFGNGVGFHTRHTLAAGLANTDELLTLLQFDLFGWPPVFAFGFLGLPFLLRRAQAWDWMALGGFGAFVLAYVAYFYHGVALGPRYYFEAMPWLLLLAGRGIQTLAQTCRSRMVAGLIVGALTLNTVFFYTPAELARRTDLSGLPGGVKLSLGFVRASPTGPGQTGLPENSVVVTNDWWTFSTSLAPLNCPRVPQCDVLYALATTPADLDRLRAQFPDRVLLQAVNDRGVLKVEPY